VSSSPLWAATLNAETSQNSATGPQLEEIVVTAQKREQTLIDVPQSISVISGATLAQQQATSFADYLNLVPGLQLNQDTPGQGRLIIRGINTGGVASTVGVYVDDTPFGSSSGLANGAILAGDFDTFDVARIEVLRGPQGTLYGANSLGGVLKFVTNAPSTDAFAMKGSVGLASVDGGTPSYNGDLMVNVPLSSEAAFRASGFYRKDGGFIDSIGTAGSVVKNDINTSSVYGGRASLLFTPTSPFSIRLNAILQNIQTDAPSLVEADPVTLQPLYGRLSQSQFVEPFTDTNYRVYNGTVDYDFGFATLTSVSSYATQKQHIRTDLTTNLSPIIQLYFGMPNYLFEAQNTNNQKFTQEFRLTSSKSDVFDWIAGAYYDHEDALILQSYNAVVPGTLTPVAGLPLLAQVSLNSKYKEIAGFADGTAHFGDRFDLELGGRYSHNSQEAKQMGDGVLAGGPTDFPLDTSSEDVFTYSVAPKLKFGTQTALYARIAKGFRPGGPNVLPPGAPDSIGSYKSDTLLSYEVGVKTESADKRYSLDLAVYHLDWKDIQLFAFVNNYGINVNGTGATSNGSEFTAIFRPIEGLDLSVNGAYVDSKLGGDTDPLVGGKEGDPLPFTPKTTVSLNGDYHWAAGASLQPFVGASMRFLSSQTGAYDGTFRTTYGHQREIPAYHVIDLRAGIDFGKYTLDAYAKNVTNSEGITSTTATTANGGLPIYPAGAIGTGIIRPRTIGLNITAAF
jgi:outer membrane receptor protein involved in Fe transport